MQAVVRVLLTLILLTAAGLLGYDLASYYLYSPWTRDARIRANVVTVAPDVSGWVDDIRVRDNQFVHKGDVLFTIDQDPLSTRARRRRSCARGAARPVSNGSRAIPTTLQAFPRGHHHYREP